ncbi:MAG: class I SAM-dependent methyltransferase [Vicinamibacterales bacterium]
MTRHAPGGDAAGVRAWYNLVADAFARRYDGESGWYLRCCEEDLLHAVVDFRGRVVLDLGTGAGRLLPRLAPIARAVVAVDLSEALLARAPRLPGTALLQMNALDLGLRAGAVDVVVSLGLCEYVEDLAPFLAEAVRVLRPGGRLAFTYHQLAARRQLVEEPPDMPYFGRTVGERSRFWTKRRHRRAAVLAAMREAGLVRPRPYRVFFRASATLEGWSRRFGDGSAGRRLLRLGALAAERTLGRGLRPLTVATTGNVLMIAEKPAS